jgi:hypothetical protein
MGLVAFLGKTPPDSLGSKDSPKFFPSFFGADSALFSAIPPGRSGKLAHDVGIGAALGLRWATPYRMGGVKMGKQHAAPRGCSGAPSPRLSEPLGRLEVSKGLGRLAERTGRLVRKPLRPAFHAVPLHRHDRDKKSKRQ